MFKGKENRQGIHSLYVLLRSKQNLEKYSRNIYSNNIVFTIQQNSTEETPDISFNTRLYSRFFNPSLLFSL